MAIDRKALLEELNRAKAASGRVRFLKKNSTTTLRIVASLVDPETQGESFYRKVAYHAKSGDTGSKLVLCRDLTYDQPCAYCLINKAAQEAGEGQIYATRVRYLMAAFDTSEARPRLQTWEIPTTVFEAIGALLLSDDWNDLLDVKEGHPVTIGKSGAGFDTTYTVGPARKPLPVDSALLKTVVDPLTALDDPGFEGQCKILGIDPSELIGEQEETAEEAETGSETEAETVTVTEAVTESVELAIGDDVECEGETCTLVALNLGERTCTVKTPKGRRVTGVSLETITKVEPPWETDDAKGAEEAPPKKLDPRVPVCFGDPDMLNPKLNECKVCDKLPACEAEVQKSKGLPSGAIVGTIPKKSSASSPKVAPIGRTSSQDILAKILGKG